MIQNKAKLAVLGLTIGLFSFCGHANEEAAKKWLALEFQQSTLTAEQQLQEMLSLIHI